MNIIELAKASGYDEQSETIPSFHQFIERFAALIAAQLMSESASICAEREWVDLTRDEAEALFWKWKHSSEYSVPLFEYRVIVDAVIAAFKEKNK